MSQFNDDSPSGESTEGVSLQAVDIMHQKFRVRMRGYDTQDVDAYLDLVAREVDRLVSENTRLQERVISMRRKIDEYRSHEQNMNAALLSVQEVSAEIKQRAQLEADRARAEAREEAEGILEQARQDSSKVLVDTRKDAERIAEEARTEAERARAALQDEIADETAALARLREETDQECCRMRDTAEAEASRITEELLTRRAELQRDIDDLTRQREQYRDALRTVIQTHLQMLEHDVQPD